MRTFITNYIAAEKARREENGEAGFSLIELIIVVVVLGILAAIAIPIFINIQNDAQQNSLDTIAANGATQFAAALAQGTAFADVDLDNLNSDTVTVTVAGTDEEDFCVTATDDGGDTGESGPGCS